MPSLRKLAVKNEYTLDFPELNEEHGARELEREFVGRIEHFLRAMGGLFASVGSWYRFKVEGQEFLVSNF